MKYTCILTALLLPITAQAAPQDTAPAAQGTTIESQSTIDPAFANKFPANTRVQIEAQAVLAAEPTWSESRPVDLKELQQFRAEAVAKKAEWLTEPSTLAMKAAAFLATGKSGASAPGRKLAIDMDVLAANSQQPSVISAQVSFLGYDQENLYGEYFTLEMTVTADGTWSINSATRGTVTPPPAPGK